ncbi:MAG: hypothetical protein KDC84_03915 [Crocinitomicaceae bacterium]|nr:hypothetical protein [Crocinitomicaceae bacterium]
MKLLSLILFLILSQSLLYSQNSEAELRNRLIKISYDSKFTDLKEIGRLKRESEKYTKSTKSLADYAVNQVKIRRTGKIDSIRFTGTATYLIANLQIIDNWEIEKDQENLAFGFGNIAHGLYGLGIYEYATIYFKRKLDLKRKDSLFLQEIYEYANCFLLMDQSVRSTITVIKSNMKEIELAADEKNVKDSVLYEFNKLLVRANYELKQYVECLALLEQNVRGYSTKLSIDKKIEAYVNLAQLKLDRGLKYKYLFDILERSNSKDERSKRKILEAKIKFSFENKLYDNLPDLVQSYLNNFANSQGDDSYKKILMYTANMYFVNQNYKKAYVNYEKIFEKFKENLSPEEELEVLGNLGYCAEEIGKKNKAIIYLKSYIEKKSELDELRKFKERNKESIIHWFREAKNVVEYKSKKDGYKLVNSQKEQIQEKEIALRQIQTEKELAEERNRLRMYVNWFIGVLAIFFIILFLYVKKSNKRNKELILNILPESIAVRIKSKGPFGVLVKQKDPIIIDEFEKSTILFTDFKGFTKIAESLTPEELVKELNTCFAKFDEISKNNTLEKIKTIGDAYMAAGGIPEINETNPIDAVKAGLEIVEFMKEFNREKKELGLPEWDIRVGINTGHIVAGVIGKHKYSYDIWGDAVNVASRMESSGEPSKVNISENTYILVKDHFNCTFRGEIEAKNKGKIKMYFVEGIK